jgi:pimeloyl-ACP methyl ester carboxylesterase
MKPTSILLWGCSIGSSHATYLASTKRSEIISGVILQSPFASLARFWEYFGRDEVGDDLKRYEKLGEHHDNVSKLEVYGNENPRPAVLLIHGTRDKDISYAHSRYLKNRFPKWTTLVTIEGADHTSISYSTCGELITRWFLEGEKEKC